MTDNHLLIISNSQIPPWKTLRLQEHRERGEQRSLLCEASVASSVLFPLLASVPTLSLISFKWRRAITSLCVLLELYLSANYSSAFFDGSGEANSQDPI